MLTVLQKPGMSGGTAHGLAVTSFPLRFRDVWTDGPLREGGAASPVANRPVYTHNVYTNAIILHSIYNCLQRPLYAYTHEIQILPVYTAIFSYIFTIIE